MRGDFDGVRDAIVSTLDLWSAFVRQDRDSGVAVRRSNRGGERRRAKILENTGEADRDLAPPVALALVFFENDLEQPWITRPRSLLIMVNYGVFSNSMSEPIEDCGELNEAQESLGEFFVASADTPVALDAAEEVFNLVLAAIVAAMERDGSAPRAFRWNPHAGALSTQERAKRVRVESFVGDHAPPSQARQQWLNGIKIMAWTCGQADCDGPAPTVHDGRPLGVNSALGAPDGLRALPPTRIGAVLVQLDVRAIKMPEFTRGACRDERQQAGKQTHRAPAAKAGIDRVSWAEVCGQIPPRHAGAQHLKHHRDHESVVLRRSAPQLPPACFGARTDNFLAVATMAQATLPAVSDSCARWERRPFGPVPSILKTRPKSTGQRADGVGGADGSPGNSRDADFRSRSDGDTLFARICVDRGDLPLANFGRSLAGHSVAGQVHSFAKGTARAIFDVDVLTNGIHLMFLRFGIRRFGMAERGLAFVGVVYDLCSNSPAFDEPSDRLRME